MTIETFVDLRGWFHERLEACLSKRGERAADETQLYLVELLAVRGLRAAPSKALSAGFPLGKELCGRPLAMILAEAATAEGEDRLRLFRGLGDEALYTAGFFSDHLEHRGITEDYVVRMGGGAYDTASKLAERSPSEAVRTEVYRELGERFVTFAHVLDDVKESTAFRTPQDIVRLYDKWRRTGSPRIAERLSAEGVYPGREAKPALH